jgi:hypothetical protein
VNFVRFSGDFWWVLLGLGGIWGLGDGGREVVTGREWRRRRQQQEEEERKAAIEGSGSPGCSARHAFEMGVCEWAFVGPLAS